MTFSDLSGWTSQLAKSLHVQQALRTNICALVCIFLTQVGNTCKKNISPHEASFSISLKTSRSCHHVSAAKKRTFLRNKGKLALYSAENVCAGKKLDCPQANKCSIVCLSQTFRSRECQQYYLRTRAPSPVRGPGHCAQIQISRCQGVYDVAYH